LINVFNCILLSPSALWRIRVIHDGLAVIDSITCSEIASVDVPDNCRRCSDTQQVATLGGGFARRGWVITDRNGSHTFRWRSLARAGHIISWLSPGRRWSEKNVLILWRCVNVHPPVSRSYLCRHPSILTRVLFHRCGYQCLSLFLSLSRSGSFVFSLNLVFDVYARVRVFATSISFARREPTRLFDNRSASILIQTATKTIPSTRRSRKITPIAVRYRLCGIYKLFKRTSGTHFWQIWSKPYEAVNHSQNISFVL